MLPPEDSDDDDEYSGSEEEGFQDDSGNDRPGYSVPDLMKQASPDVMS